MDKVRGLISETDFLEMSKDFTEEKSRLESLIAVAHTQISDLDARLSAGDDRRAMIERYTNLEHLTREMVEALIEYITVGKRAKGEKTPPVEIPWNF